MNDLCLKFADEAEALSVLTACGLATYTPEQVETVPAAGVCLDIVGVISRLIGEPDADGVQPTEQLPGWHVNALLSGDVPDQLRPYIVQPSHRMRVWA